MSWWKPARSTEATAEQLVATGAAGAYGVDPIDGDRGYTQVGAGRREMPGFTLEKARAFSISAYRSNPMARAIIDTYTSFCVGDSGLTFQCPNPEVYDVVEKWWHDPRNQIGDIQTALLRDHMLMGETALEQMVGPITGVNRISPIDTSRIGGIRLQDGNPLWPRSIVIDGGGGELTIVAVDDVTGLRTGQVSFFASWKALVTDRRGMPFLTTIIDQLDAYDSVISNLIDRTALARYLVWDVTVEGDQDDVDAFVTARKGLHTPPSGTVEVHNEAVKWDAKSVNTGAYEDVAMLGGVLTNVAAGAGLAKPWLAEPGDSNRATSLTMAEPVRRRVGGVQNLWVGYVAELVKFAVDQAVAARRLPAMVEAPDARGDGGTVLVPASRTVRVTGPEIAAADAQVTATVLMNLATALESLVGAQILTKPAAALAVEKGWEQFVGQPFPKNFAIDPNAVAVDDVADAIDSTGTRPLKAV